MSYADSIEKFAKIDFLPEGWYWLVRAADLRMGKALPIHFWNRDFVLYRSQEKGEVHLLDAYCPHMGAHLCDGKVEGDNIRCPFHNWKFDGQGKCVDIPAQKETAGIPKLESYRVEEAYGLVWLWTGEYDANEPIPVVPELKGLKLDSKLGNSFIKDCHPNVVMINAIDAHHFRSVHKLIVDLKMRVTQLSQRCVQFSNCTPVPNHPLIRWVKKWYKVALTYEMTYWWGHTGSVMVGPDFLHFYIIFALRPTADGKTEGQTILVTKQRMLGWLINPIVLFLTRLVGDYFAKGDTMIFNKIKFQFRTPIRADQAIVQFIEHYENQSASCFGKRAELNVALRNGNSNTIGRNHASSSFAESDHFSIG